jgi:hypothetical protein
MGLFDFIKLIKTILTAIKDACSSDAAKFADYRKILRMPMQYVFFGSYSDDPTYSHTASDFNGIFTTAYNAIFVIAAIFIMISFFRHIYELMYNDRLTFETLIKHCIAVCVILLLIGNGPVITSYFYEFFDVLGTDIANKVEETVIAETEENNFASLVLELFGLSEDKGLLRNFVTLIGEGGVVGACLNMILSVILAFIMSIIIRLTVAKNAIERAIRFIASLILLPFGVCELYDQQNNITLTSYLKNIGIVILEIYVILFEITIINQLFDFFSAGYLPNLLGKLMAFFLTVSAINNAEMTTKGIFQ